MDVPRILMDFSIMGFTFNFCLNEKSDSHSCALPVDGIYIHTAKAGIQTQANLRPCHPQAPPELGQPWAQDR